ncbi:hypothetical protein Tco_1262019, partial [Tanacetum coccineum]
MLRTGLNNTEKYELNGQTLEDRPAPANLKADEKPPETAFHSQKVASSPHHHPHVRYGLVGGPYGALNAGAMPGHSFHRRTNVLVCLFSDSPLLSQTCSSRSNVKCWNMLFFLWGEFRGRLKNSMRQVPNCSENNGIPNGVSSMPTDKMSSAQDACLGGPIDK